MFRRYPFTFIVAWNMFLSLVCWLTGDQVFFEIFSLFAVGFSVPMAFRDFPRMFFS